MKAVAVKMGFEVYATTQSECIAKMDEVGNAFLDVVGGAPWVAHDDDVIKRQAQTPGHALSDDQGYVYHGSRTYVFAGPALAERTQQQHDGFRVQKGIEEG